MSAGSIPVIIFKRVDFPAPLIPTIAAFSWSSILKEQDLIITSVPKDLLILLDVYKRQEFKSEASEVAAIMASAKEETVAMLPQPFATTVLMNNKEARIALDVTKEWENVSKDGSTVVTGVIVVNTEYYNNHKAAVDKFLEEYKLSADYVNANVDEVSTLVEKYGITKAAVAKQAIPKCNITIITGSDAKDKISKYLNVLYEANPASVGGKLPEDNFYK